MNLNKAFALVAGLLLLLVLWEGAVLSFPSLLFVLPAPSKIFTTLFEMRSRFCHHTLVTLKEMAGGFLLALCCAFPLAWTMMRYQTSRTLLQPLFIITQCLPMFTLAPIMVIWFGWGYTAIVIPTALMIFFPLTLNIYQGFRSTPQELLDFFKANRATGWQTLIKLRLPFAVPHIFSGFRISSAIAGVGAVAGEWAGGQHGLGILMLESRRNTDLEITFGALVLLTLISSLLYGCIVLFEKNALPPRPIIPLLQPRNFMKKRKRNLVTALLILLSSLLFVGCHKREKTHLLLDWLPNPNHIPLYVGCDKGFFEEEGIELCIEKMHESGGGISFLTSRQADLLVYHLPNALKACSRGAQLKIAGLLIKEPLRSLIFREDLNIAQPSDLSEHVLGYCVGGSDTAFLDHILSQKNIKPKERRNVSVDLISAIGTRNVDFVYGGFWNIEPHQLKNLGVATHFFKIQDLGVPSYYEMIILANSSASDAFISSFKKALQKSIDFCKAHPEEAFESYLAHNPDRRKKTLSWEKEAWAVTYPLLATDQSIDEKEVETFYHWAQEIGILKSPFEIQSLIVSHN